MKKQTLTSITIATFLLFGSFSPVLADIPTVPVAQPPSGQRDKYQTDLFTGSANYSYPIAVPKGTNSLTPQVALSYNSGGSHDTNMQVGSGWQLDNDYIQRDVNYTPSNTNDDKYKLHFNGSTYDLVYNTTDNLYHTKIESHLKIQQLTTGGQGTTAVYWQVTNTDGTLYRFGYTSNSELMCNGQSYEAYWNEDQVTDTHNNHIYYTYTNTNGEAYLSQIKYNNDQLREIDFNYASNAYQHQIYVQGCNITESNRLSNIQVKANNNLVHQYDLSYTTATSGVPLLQSVTEKGSDSSALPPTTFSYNNEATTWATQATFWDHNNALDADLNNSTMSVRLLDANGDGFTDILKVSWNGGNDTYQVFKNLGNTWSNQPETWLNNNPMDARPNQYWTRLIDVNGDGLPDIVKATSDTWYVWKNTGSSWSTSPETWASGSQVPGFTSTDNKVALIDVNGDGLPDVVQSVPVSGPNWTWKVYKNTGSSFSTTPELWINNQNVDAANIANPSDTLADVNGDGLPDIIHIINNGGPNNDWTVYLNTGSSWNTNAQTWDNPIDANFDNGNITLADVNGDGLPDIIKVNNNGGPNQDWEVYLNTGHSWAPQSVSWVSNASIDANTSFGNTLVADVNGDGLSDVINQGNTGGPNNDWRVFPNNPNAPELLSDIHTEQGGSIHFDYSKSTSYQNTSLPFPMWVVSKMTVNNGLSNSQATNDSTTYSYKNGYYNWQNHEFRGFGEVDETDPNGSQKQTLFKQDDALKGTIYQQKTSDSSGNPYTETDDTWNSAQTNGVYTNTLTSEKNYTFDGSASNPKTTETDYQYDQYGNVTKKSELGDTSVTGDEKYTYYGYTYNPSIWLVNTLNDTYVNDPDDSTKVSETWDYYDGNLGLNDAPTKGDLTKEVKWLNGGSNPTTTYQYDSYGNQTQATDANGHTTTTAYGTNDTTNTYPDSQTNAKNQTTAFSYGLGTGNLLSKTDPNGFTTSYTYDPFGRVSKEIDPYDSAGYPTKSYTYFDNSLAPQGTLVSQLKTSSQSGTLDTYTFIDGLGRTLQTRQDAEDTNKQIVKDTFYDSTGEIKKETMPYLATSSKSSTTLLDGEKFGDGSDGDLTISSNTTETPIDSSVNATANSTTASVGSGLNITPNKIVLFHQTQGTNAGTWELARVQSYSGTTLTLTAPLTNTYATSGSNHAQIRIVPQYHNVTINNGVTWTAKAWDGSTGGILIFLANGTVTVNGTINANGWSGSGESTAHVTGGGFRGGAYVGTNTHQSGFQGEGSIGDSAQSTNANGNGAGAGGFTSSDNTAASGGGGSLGTQGTAGPNYGNSTGGAAGNIAGSADLTTLLFGGAGGSGASSDNSGGGVGGNGGGIIFISGDTITVSGAINANGGNGGNAVVGNNIGGGGAGAGGSIFLKSQTATLGSGLVTANGGIGGGATGSHGPGGNGGNGRIRVDVENVLTGTYGNPDATAKYTSYTYDPLARVIKVTNPQSTFSTTTYDHWKQTDTDENGHPKKKVTDAYNNIIEVDEYNNGQTYTTEYTYDPLNNLTKIVDANANTFNFTFDTLKRRTAETDPDMGTWTYTYDGVDNLLTKTDNRNITTTKTYDELNRVTRVHTPHDADILYTYDGNNKIGTLTSVTDAAGTENYAYDNRLRKTQEQRVTDGTTWTTAYAYDASDRIISTTKPDGEVVTNTFNAQGQIASVSGVLNNIDYNALNKITDQQYANGLTTNYSYNTTDFRLNQIQTGTVQDIGYSYDNVGNVASISDNLLNKTQTFGYDDLDRLLTASESAGYNFAYTYNPIGNLTAVNKDGTAINYTYGQNAGVHALTSSSEPGPSITPTPTPSQTNSYTIYDEGLGSGWEDWSWGSTNNDTDTTHPNTGSLDLSWIVNSAYGGINLHNVSGVDTTPYTNLTFALRATQANQHVQVQFHDASDVAIGNPIPLTNYGGDPLTGSYTTYTIPLSVLGATNRVITGLIIQDITGAAEPVMYVDTIKLTGNNQSPTPTATPTNTPTPTPTPAATATTIYDESLASGWQDWSWSATNNFNDTAHPYAGTKDLSWTNNAAYGALYLHNSAGFNSATYDSLTFALRATQAGQQVQVQLYDASDNAIGTPVSVANYGGDPVAGSYKVYTIPLADLGGANQTLHGFILQDRSGSAEPAMYIDSIALQSHSANSYTAQYFSNMTLSGTPTITRQDPEINFDWGSGSPDPAIPVDGFSARWTKTTNFTAGTYKFSVTADDGVRLYIDNQLVIDKWIDQGATTYTTTQTLTAGAHTIKVEYYENSGGALAQFSYQPDTDLALNKTAVASSLEDPSLPASQAVDGNSSTRWSSGYSDPQWIYVDLGASHTINEVKLNWEAAYATAYQIQVSNDATNWTTMYSTTTGPGGHEDLTGLNGTGRYVRMYGTQRAINAGYSLWDFEVYGQ